MATAVLDYWTEINCIQLIREFRARPILWDQKDPFYYKKSLKPKLWEEIGAKLDIPALKCKHKMNILMSSFRREKAKILHKLEENNGATSSMCVTTWFAFKEMLFLMDKETERKRQEMGSEKLYEEIDDGIKQTISLKRTLLRHHIQPPISNNKQSRFSGFMREIAKQSISTTTTTNMPDRSEPTQVQPVATTSSSETDDEIKSFSNFISFKMKKYSQTTKNAVQQAICGIIFKADQNFYENKDKFVIMDETDQVSKNESSEEEESISSDIKEEYDDAECYIEDDGKLV